MARENSSADGGGGGGGGETRFPRACRVVMKETRRKGEKRFDNRARAKVKGGRRAGASQMPAGIRPTRAPRWSRQLPPPSPAGGKSRRKRSGAPSTRGRDVRSGVTYGIKKRDLPGNVILVRVIPLVVFHRSQESHKTLLPRPGEIHVGSNLPPFRGRSGARKREKRSTTNSREHTTTTAAHAR